MADAGPARAPTEAALPPPAPHAASRLPLGIAVSAFLFYLYCLAPGTTFGDGPQFQTDAWLGRISSAAYAHALYTLLGYAFTHALPVGTVAWRMNVMTALWAAVTLGLVAAAIPRLLRRVPVSPLMERWSTVVACGLLAFNYTFWSHATTAEVYSLSTAFLALALWFAARFEETADVRFAAALVATLCVGAHHHLQVPFFLLWWGPWVLWRVRVRCGWSARTLGTVVLGWALGSIPFAALVLYDYLAQVRMLSLTLYFTFGGPFVSQMAGQNLDWAWAAKNTTIDLLWDLTPWGLLAAATGVWAAWREDRVLFGWLVPAALLTGGYAATYNVGDQHAFFQPLWLVATPLIALGLRRWATHWNERRLSAYGLLMLAVPLVVNWNLPHPESRRDWEELRDYTAERNISHPIVSPNRRGQTWADDWAVAVLESAQRNARIIAYWWADFHGYQVLRYHQRVTGARPDVTISEFMGQYGQPIDFTELFEAEVDRRAVYLTTYTPWAYRMGQLRARFTFEQEGPLIRVRRRPGVAPWRRGPDLPPVGVWRGRATNTGHRARLVIRNWDRGLAGWFQSEIPGHLRVETPFTAIEWNSAASTLNLFVADVGGQQLELRGTLTGDRLEGVWRLGLVDTQPRFAGWWYAERVATNPFPEGPSPSSLGPTDAASRPK